MLLAIKVMSKVAVILIIQLMIEKNAHLQINPI